MIVRTMAAALVLAAGTASAAPRAAVPLVPAGEARLPAPALAALCVALAKPCAPGSVKPMVAASAPQGRLFLLDGARPWLAELDEAAPLDAGKAHVWDFSAYRHSVPAISDGGEPLPLTVYPALYPVGAQGRAVAIVSTARENYSGGSAFFDSADFVALDEAPKAAASAPAVVYAGVPFACAKMVRACFFEKDYKRSLHCQDTSDGHLTLGFEGKGAAPGWSFRWHETNWPAHVAKTKQRTTHTAFTVPAGPRAAAEVAAPEGASFCGGPV